MITHISDQVKIILTSQLIKSISVVLKKLLNYFNGTIISTLFISPSSSVWPVIFALKLNELVALAPLKPTISPLLFTAGISLQYCHKLPNNYRYILLSYTLALLYQYLQNYLLGYYLFCLCSHKMEHNF